MFIDYTIFILKKSYFIDIETLVKVFENFERFLFLVICNDRFSVYKIVAKFILPNCILFKHLEMESHVWKRTV